MATEPFWKRVKGLAKIEHGLGVIATFLATKSFPITWLVWDSLLSIKLYFHQKLFPDQAIRLGRLGMAVGVLVNIINPIVGGAYFIGDGLYSIFRYRFRGETVEDVEDFSRLGRIGIGSLLIASAFIIL